MDRRVPWSVAVALGALAAHPRDAAADPPATWQVAWRRACHSPLYPGADRASDDEREVAWCRERFDARSGRYLGLQPQPTLAEESRSAPTWRPMDISRGDARIEDCDEDSALVRRRGRVELRIRNQSRPALTFRRGFAPTHCARSDDGSQLAVSTADGVTMHVRRGVGYVATARWTERDLLAIAFVDHGSTLLGWRSDETLLTAWRIGAPTVARGLPTSPGPRAYACEAGRHGVPWMFAQFAYDAPPRAPRAEHGLLGMCDGADVYATDAAEFADFRADDRRWARAVEERYGFARTARVWRTPWGDRVAAWSYVGSPGPALDYRYDVRVVEHGDTLYRVQMQTLHTVPYEHEEGFPDGRYEVALDRGRMDTLLRAMFAPSHD